MATQESIHQGWLYARDGNKFAPITLIDDVYAMNGQKYKSTVDNKFSSMQNSFNTDLSSLKSSLEGQIGDIEDVVDEHTRALGDLDKVDEEVLKKLTNFGDDGTDALYIVDKNDKVIAYINGLGVHSVDFTMPNENGFSLAEFINKDYASFVTSTNTTLSTLTKKLENFGDDEGGAFYIVDKNDMVIAYFNETGANSTNFTTPSGNLNQVISDLSEEIAVRTRLENEVVATNTTAINSIRKDIQYFNAGDTDDTLYVIDKNNMVMAYVDETGLHSLNVYSKNFDLEGTNARIKNIEDEIIPTEVSKLTTAYQTADSSLSANISSNGAQITDINNRLQYFSLDGDSTALYIIDKNNNTIAYFDETGLTTTDLTIGKIGGRNAKLHNIYSGTFDLKTYNFSVEGGGSNSDPVALYTFTINPTPSNAIVTLTAAGYTQSNNSISTPAGTNIAYSVASDGYVQESGNYVMGSSNYSTNIVLESDNTQSASQVMTVNIDLSNSDPAACCSYADDAAGMPAGANDWDTFFGHYPVLMKNGVEVVKLNPNNYSQDINGNAVDIESGDAGDVMIAFPRKGLKISKKDKIVTVSFTSETSNTDYQYYAHTHNKDLNTFYVGAYDGYIDGNGKLRSLSGKTPTVNTTIGAFRTAAQLNGDDYEQFAYYQLVYLQAMFIMKYKSLNGQTSFGQGLTGADAKINTGTMNTMGLDYGDTSGGTVGMKFAGIENFWGNIFKWVDGIVTDANRNYLTTTGTFNDSGSNYEFTSTTGFTSNTYGYYTDCVGTSEGGFAMTAKGGSSTTYFSDYAGCFASKVAYFGGPWSYGLYAGPFCLDAGYSASSAYSDVGARIQKL